MYFGTLILDFAWQQAAIFFVTAVATASAALVLSRWNAVSRLRLLGAAVVSVMLAGAGVDTMTSSARIDARGVTIDSQLDFVHRRASLSWHDMIGAEIVSGHGLWNQVGMRLVSRIGTDIVVPIGAGAMASKDIPLLLDHVAAQPRVRMLPDAATFFAKAEQAAPKLEGRLRARPGSEHIAYHWFQSQTF
jgi:hypothetical protein